MRRGVRISGAPGCHRHGESVFVRTRDPPVMVAPWGQVGAHRLDLTHSRQTSLACDSVYLNKVYSYSILSKRGPHRSRNDERTADLTQNFYLPPGAAAGDTVDPVSVFEELTVSEPELTALRASVRDFLRNDRAEFGWQPTVDAWLSRWDEAFSARLGDAGFLGLTIPTVYGGQGRGHLQRYVVTEELLAHGAPVAAHWVADRQVAPAVMTYGTDEQRQRILPRIAKGRLFSAIGMSEPQAGSAPTAAGYSTAERFGLVAHTAPTRSWCWLDPAPSSHSSGTPASASSSCRPMRRECASSRSSRWTATIISTRPSLRTCSSPTPACSAKSATAGTR